MAADLTLFSWNIKQLAIAKSRKVYFQTVFKYISDYADIVLVMEVSPVFGATVLSNIKKALNATTPNKWQGQVSPKNAAANNRKGDAYAIFYRTSSVKSVNIAQFPPECDANNNFNNSIFGVQRNPYNFFVEMVSGEKIDLYIYHAPEPSDQAVVKQYVRAMANIADLSKGYNYAVCGDFNTNEANISAALAPLKNLKFKQQITANTTTPGCIPSFGALTYSNPYDNILTKNVTPSDPGRIDVVTDINTNKKNLKTSYTGGVIANIADALWVYKDDVSDHLPVQCDIDF
jgi:hypothetical protein